jgi:hypothetical protein
MRTKFGQAVVGQEAELSATSEPHEGRLTRALWNTLIGLSIVVVLWGIGAAFF